MAFLSLVWVAALAIPAIAQDRQPDWEKSPMVAPQLQPDAHNTAYWPWRSLPWGEINFLHTTDSHGWLEGHLNEVNYGADLGDLVSFMERMRDKADQYNVDLLVVDTGDIVTGNGLSDVTNPQGRISNKIFRNLPYDLLTIGNNDLYDLDVTKEIRTDLARIYGDRYLTSNVDVDIDGKNVSIGHRYRYFTTKHGLKVVAFGFTVQDFARPAAVSVQGHEAIVETTWFQEAMSKDADLYLLIGHADVAENCKIENPKYGGTENPLICMKDWFRTNKPNTPLQILGGHTHFRKFQCYDGASSGLESGRYSDTVGWLALRDVAPSDSLSGSGSWNGSKTITGVDMPTRTCPPSSTTSSSTDAISTKVVRLDRRYLDFNRQTFAYHAIGATGPDIPDRFDTPLGLKTTDDIYNARVNLNLTKVLGCAPQTYYIWSERFNCPGNIFSMVRLALNTTVNRNDSPRLILMNTAGIRYDLYKGPFSVGDGFTVSPYNDPFLYLANVPYDTATQVICKLNNGDMCENEDPAGACDMSSSSTYPPGPNNGVSNQQPLMNHPAIEEQLNPGHVTADDFGNCSISVSSPDCGDDTQHRAVPEKYLIPKNIQAKGNIVTGMTKTVDLVFTEHLKKGILNLDIIKNLGYTDKNVSYYMEKSFTTRSFLQKYAQVAWNENSTSCSIGP
ncbi:Ser/Thr protein phosphatase family protein [Aspergillus heteromorphus CBS 117.55]|uniref:Ser/Thr protein phosphatase family protein n=1 Tax=Aspergillus heteromorphus CBS 117.55 TaxID=1448321 RepID=A0A317VQ82_9EURO|nr:Ser/Thr protein phosphatase family protein [Aspergillus heteromorphus CBS 117.55]PWY75048.1 Ser/Thr protein phosphatase family protein [Aspergillus heteromorphus CBS 117.55]